MKKANEFFFFNNDLKLQEIISDSPAIEDTKELQKVHSNKAMDVLQSFQESDARTALSNIIVAMGDGL